MEKKCKVFLLKTDKETNIFKDIGKLFYSELEAQTGKSINSIVDGLFMYILSYDEIKERDWVYEYVPVGQKPYISEIHKVISIDKKEGIIEFEEHTVGIGFCKKIIATTNPDLIKEGVSSIDNDFIKKYCNNTVDEVIVKYEEIHDYNNQYEIKRIYKPKISSNNSIIIKPVEETWDDIYNEINNSNFNSKIEMFTYLKENYNVPTKK